MTAQMPDLTPDATPAPSERPIHADIQSGPRARWPDLTWLFMVIAGGLVGGLIIQWPGLEYCPNDGSRWDTVYMLVEHGTYHFKLNHGATFRDETKFPRSVNVSTMPAEEVDRLVKEEKLIRAMDEGVTRYYHPTGSPPQPGDFLFLPLFPTIDMVYMEGRDKNYHYFSSKPPLLPTMLAGVVWAIEKVTKVSFRSNPWFIIRTTLVIVQALPLMAFIWILGKYVRGLTSSWFVHAFCLAAAAFGTYLTPWSVTLNNHVIAAFSGMFALYATTQIWYAGRREWYLFACAGFFGVFTAVNELPATSLALAVMIALFIRFPKQTLKTALLPALIPIMAFLLTNYLELGTISPAYSDFGRKGGGYDYPGSYWRNPQGMDALHEPRPVYLANIVIGHHGFFLLMPVLLVGLAGMAAQLSFRSQTRPLLAFFVLATTAIVIWFYTYAPFTTESKNYGGTTQGPRWFFWLIPLWLTMLPPGVEWLARNRFTRGILYFLLCASAVSVGFALRQPWAASWAHLLFREFKWIDY